MPLDAASLDVHCDLGRIVVAAPLPDQPERMPRAGAVQRELDRSSPGQATAISAHFLRCPMPSKQYCDRLAQSCLLADLLPRDDAERHDLPNERRVPVPPRSIADVARSQVVGSIVSATPRPGQHVVRSPLRAEGATTNVTAPPCLLPNLFAKPGRQGGSPGGLHDAISQVMGFSRRPNVVAQQAGRATRAPICWSGARRASDRAWRSLVAFCHRSSDCKPVRFAIRANIRGPISSSS